MAVCLETERSKTRVKSARQSAEKEDEKVEEGKEMVKTVVKTSRGTIDRLSTPKQSPSAQGKETATAKRESPVRVSFGFTCSLVFFQHLLCFVLLF